MPGWIKTIGRQVCIIKESLHSFFVNVMHIFFPNKITFYDNSQELSLLNLLNSGYSQ